MASPSRRGLSAFEIMVTTPAISNLIRNNDINRIQDVIQTSRDKGMITLDDHLADLVRKGMITADVALAAGRDTQHLDRLLGLDGSEQKGPERSRVA